jgi:flagellin
MQIRNNISSLFAWRSLAQADSKRDQSIGRLSSGLRIGSASDDASGIGISERIRSQFRGLTQATRNAMDGMSLVNTAESTLGEINGLLQRGRELSLQAASDVLGSPQKQSIQSEIDQLLAEVNRISDTAEFNGILLLSSGGSASATATALTGLRSGWLTNAQNIIQTYYGITGDGTNMTIVLETSGTQSGWVTGTPGAGGKLTNLQFHLNVNSLSSATDPDRITARTLTQAYMARNSNFGALAPWFVSGASDFIAGADELLYAATQSNSVATIVNAIATPWQTDSLHQTSAYLATKYLNSLLTGAGMAMSDVMAWLTGGNSLDSALSLTIGMDQNAFLADFQANGGAFLNGLISSGALTNPDVGGINPGNSQSVIPDGGTYAVNPPINFNLTWSSAAAAATNMVLQVGANQPDQLSFTLPQIDTNTLNLVGIDVVNNAQNAIDRFGASIGAVSGARASLGSVSNRLEHTMAANTQADISEQSSFSRIVDLDMAHETMNLTKQQLVVSSAGSMLAQANALRQNINWLLNGLAGSSSLTRTV